jgi:hypothetical protein
MNVPTRTQDQTLSQLVRKIVNSEGNWDSNNNKAKESQFKECSVNWLLKPKEHQGGRVQEFVVRKEVQLLESKFCIQKAHFSTSLSFGKCRDDEDNMCIEDISLDQ